MRNVLFPFILIATGFFIVRNISFHDASSTLPRETEGNTMDIAVADMDMDGDPDLVLAMEWKPNLLLLNDGKGNLTPSPKPNFANQHFDSEDIAIADYDKDGDPDVVFAAEDDGKHEYYLNEKGGQMSLAPFQFPHFISNSVATIDLNGDGYSDLVFGNQGPEKIFINDKKAGFIDESAKRIPQLNDVTQDVKLADIDKDGDPDIILANEDRNRVYINDGKGFFKDETDQRFPAALHDMESRKATLSDVDGDNDLDIYYSNVAFIPGKDPQDRLYLNNGKGVFTDATSTHLVFEREHNADAVFMDMDEDKDLDLVVGSFSPTGTKVYRNEGGKFLNRIDGLLPDLKAQNISVMNADLNGDRLDDLYIGNFRGKDFLFLQKR